ncbi:phosphopantothenoylcysteine decarboxylase [Staphylococcus succinus]|uniref:DNA/pantothenate metabolism flavoprotein C-terminal domain-containing protein n=1 Tax=Staphylococcus succinus TaxID=61015 RepID=A0A9Q6HQY9_9STAP|nr:phosphopantothenoylcysteine decarboxylase [Staphylococcus succinus]MEB8126906.1 hypothetical protein [Staphylococcus succinus]MEB8209036.1 hypothetical protein [Staphylococcus succinus]PTI36619.1 hypothetical protein BU062_13825 [Staphylococcus succinus]PTI77192.1 hypothetical protein BU058_01640 [Staphylococcus succinus]PTJ16735.1 hypothetical protein BU069_08810 [Staphylococcus succinus]
MKNILIITGGCIEKWDDVRGHTNLATGSIGTYLSNELSNYDFNIYYLSGYTSKQPDPLDNIKDRQTFLGIVDLRDKAKAIILQHDIDIVIMSAAGSDWIFDYIEDKETGEILDNNNKISSDIVPVVHLKKAPKVLKLFKEWKKDLFVVGFKLETEDIIERALKRMKSSDVDVMIANHANSLQNHGVHHHIITRENDVIEAHNKKETAQQLSKLLNEKFNS